MALIQFNCGKIVEIKRPEEYKSLSDNEFLPEIPFVLHSFEYKEYYTNDDNYLLTEEELKDKLRLMNFLGNDVQRDIIIDLLINFITNKSPEFWALEFNYVNPIVDKLIYDRLPLHIKNFYNKIPLSIDEYFKLIRSNIEWYHVLKSQTDFFELDSDGKFKYDKYENAKYDLSSIVESCIKYDNMETFQFITENTKFDLHEITMAMVVKYSKTHVSEYLINYVSSKIEKMTRYNPDFIYFSVITNNFDLLRKFIDQMYKRMYKHEPVDCACDSSRLFSCFRRRTSNYSQLGEDTTVSRPELIVRWMNNSCFLLRLLKIIIECCNYDMFKLLTEYYNIDINNLIEPRLTHICQATDFRHHYNKTEVEKGYHMKIDHCTFKHICECIHFEDINKLIRSGFGDFLFDKHKYIFTSKAYISCAKQKIPTDDIIDNMKWLQKKCIPLRREDYLRILEMDNLNLKRSLQIMFS